MKSSEKKGIATGYAEDGRFFLEFNEALIERILAVNVRLKLESLWTSEDVGGRNDFRWINGIVRLV